MTPAFIRDRLAAVIRTPDDGQPGPDRIIIDEWEQNGGTITISIDVDTLAAMFADVDTNGDPDDIRDAMLAADQIEVGLDAAGNEVPADSDEAATVETRSRGYADIICLWHQQGLLGPPETPNEAILRSGRRLRDGHPVFGDD